MIQIVGGRGSNPSPGIEILSFKNETSGTNLIKLFVSVIYKCLLQVIVFVLIMSFQPSVIKLYVYVSVTNFS